MEKRKRYKEDHENAEIQRIDKWAASSPRLPFSASPRLRGFRFFCLLAIGLLVLAGCGQEGAPRYHLSGKITFGGQPVPTGLIFFEPDATKGNRGPQGFAKITDGEYGTNQFGKGAVCGPLTVMISGFQRIEGSSEESPGKPLFPRYNTQIDLPEEASTFDFEIPTK